ncbi:uncharacterized protein JCM10292_006593 [Rhodotorula paludigena]|uniref:uncharacterized protein n=1 Tax=Rhodotorula paludigena TaxID=86838 RepID=UPI00317BC99B
MLLADRLAQRSRRLRTSWAVAGALFLLLVVERVSSSAGYTRSAYTTSGLALRLSRQSVPKASFGDDLTFTEYLDAHFPQTARYPPHLWLTLSDKAFAGTAIANLDAFVDQLNSERRVRYGRDTRETRLVVLCIFKDCVEEAERRGLYAYGGYQRTRPEIIFHATWPKLASFIEILPQRDLFFLDADVAFALDPYPHMERYMNEGFDIIAQENNGFEHFNTGWMWMRKGQVIADAWQEVLERDMVTPSRDQNNFNEVLDTGPRRLHKEGRPERRPLLSDFVSKQGLKVHVLDPRLFRAYHHWNELFVKPHESLMLHSTCADDIPVKLFLPKVQGFWMDLDDYYSQPAPILSVDIMSGTQEDLTQLFKVVLAGAYYAGRAVMLPGQSTVMDLANTTLTPTPIRLAQQTFPLSQLAMPDSPLGVRVVEPEYVDHAVRHLMGRSTLDSAKRRDDGWWESLGKAEQVRRLDTVANITKIVDIDMRHQTSFGGFVARLTQEHNFHDAAHVRLVNTDWPFLQHWRGWTDLPEPVRQIETCRHIEEMQTCVHVCRFDDDVKVIKSEGAWPSVESVIGDEGI